MFPRERANNPSVAIRSALYGHTAEMWTALPAEIISFDPVNRTVQAKPTIVMQLNDPITGGVLFEAIPIINDIPVVFPRGGGYELTFPLTPGDECLLVFSSRCIDNWWYYGGFQLQGDLRMHDLSDGFCLPGPLSKPEANATAPVSTSAVQLRNTAGTTHIDLSGSGVFVQTGEQVTVQATGAVTIESSTKIQLIAPPNTITANGNVLG